MSKHSGVIALILLVELVGVVGISYSQFSPITVSESALPPVNGVEEEVTALPDSRDAAGNIVVNQESYEMMELQEYIDEHPLITFSDEREPRDQ